MPLANCRDKITQVKWDAILNTALGRLPEGMWLPRPGSHGNADGAGANGIKFTILRPARPSAFVNAAAVRWQ